MEKLTKYLIPISIVIAAILIICGFVYVEKIKSGGFGKKGAEANLLTSQQAAEKAVDYINKNLVQGTTTVSLVSVAEENDLYRARVKVGEQEFNAYITKNGKLLFLQAFDLDKPLAEAEEEESQIESTIGNFSVSEDEICKENEKPILYFFGSKTCPHCQWEHPIVEKVAKQFEGNISFHNNMDSDADNDIFSQYSESGGVPTIVIGCKYFRLGSGENQGEEEETKILTALICKVTDKKPNEVCNGVQDLIDQIK